MLQASAISRARLVDEPLQVRGDAPRDDGGGGLGWFGRVVIAFLAATTLFVVVVAVLVEPGAWFLGLVAVALLGVWVWSTADL